MKLKLLIAMTVLVAGTAQATIQFKGGWDSAENSDAGVYTQSAATEFLKNKSDDLRKIIEGPAACVLEVTLGCHQPNDPHFTVNGLKSTDKCKVKSLYVGSKSDHAVGC
jgi:hypothetical protein